MNPQPGPFRTPSLLASAVLVVLGALHAADAPEGSTTNTPPTAPSKETPSTNSPAADARTGETRTGRTETAAPTDPSKFVRFVPDRNIFDPERRPRNAGESRRGPERPRNTVTPSITLVGVLESGRGRLAFFDGPASEYRKTTGTNGIVAGFTVSEIRNASVVLRPKEGAEFELALGKAHRLDGAEPVEAPAGASTDTGGTAASDTTPPAAASGDAADVLRKLMQKREQESK